MIVLFSITMGLSALLLFWVQPLFTRMVLPLLGGSPAVWTVAVVLFQATLLAGYLYAHLLTRVGRLGRQVALHAVVLLLPLTLLPFAIPDGLDTPPAGAPMFWLLGVFAVVVAVPFFAVTATAPLLQAWFARSGHLGAANPYVLYAASNIGSVLALVAYPFVMEPLLRLSEQSALWTASYLLVALLIVVSGYRAMRVGPAAAARVSAGGTASDVDLAPVTWARRGRWLVLSFVPSALMLAVTLYITTDVAAVPLFWVVPLTLYLLSFVVVFARRQFVAGRWLLLAQAVLALVLAATLWWRDLPLWFILAAHIGFFTLTALVCHGRLAMLRPPPRQLTEFYLCMSLGGVAGGLFVSVLAPLLFDDVWEYPVLLVLAALLRPSPDGAGRRRWAADLLLPALLAALLLPPVLLHIQPTRFGPLALTAYGTLAATLVYSLIKRPLRLGAGVAVLLAAGLLAVGQSQQLLARERSFFGVIRVEDDAEAGVRRLLHGTTLHGLQFLDPARATTPLAYYARSGPLGQALAALNRPDAAVAVVGLGAGAISCHMAPGQSVRFYEIDPAVVGFARGSGLFDLLPACAGTAEIVVGDARLSLAKAAEARYDILILDAFSSDAIPVHLLTREALGVYLGRLAPDGVIVAHISNRHLDLEPQFAALAQHYGLAGLFQWHGPSRADGDAVLPSKWVVLSPSPGRLAALAGDTRWRKLRFDPEFRLWTDDYANVVGAMVASWK